MMEPRRRRTVTLPPYGRGGPQGTLGRAVARLRRTLVRDERALEIPPDVAEKLHLPGLPPDMAARRGQAARGARVRTTVLAVVTSATLTGLGGYFVGASAVGERSDPRVEGLAAERDYWHQTSNSVRDFWAERDVCEAEIRGGGKDPRVLGLFPGPELRVCYEEQEARVARLLDARGGEEAADD